MSTVAAILQRDSLELGRAKAGHDPLGHPPDVGVVEPVRGELAAARHGDRSGRCGRSRGRAGDRGAPSAAAATSGLSFRSGRGRERRRRGGRRSAAGRGAGHHVVETADQVVRVELEPDFLEGLAHGGGRRGRLRRGPAAPGQRHVPRPRITCPLGPADEQHGVGIGRQDHRDRRPDERIADRPPVRRWTARRSRSRVSRASVVVRVAAAPAAAAAGRRAQAGSDRPACRPTRAER